MLGAGSVLARSGGFTTIELAIVLLILGILAAIGLPSFNQFITQNRIKASTEALQNGVQLARGEAIRLNQKVRFTLGVGTAWSVNIDTGGAIVQESRASGEGGSADVVSLAAPAGATQVTFNGLGRIVANTNASDVLAAIDISVAGAPADTVRRIQVSNPGGQVRICMPAIPVAGSDPRRCLP